VFVVDAYTRRIFSRHSLCAPDIAYEPLRALFERNLEADLHLYKEYHGLIVFVGKDFCRRTPKCAECPLGVLLEQHPA
jgi:endonuclease-3 related protein